MKFFSHLSYKFSILWLTVLSITFLYFIIKNPYNAYTWQKKIVLKVKDEDQIYILKVRAEEAGLTTALITDAGKTVIAPGTVTCLAIGPDIEGKIDKIIGELKLM